MMLSAKISSSHHRKPPGLYEEKKLHGALSVCFSTPVQRAALGITMTFNGWGEIIITAWPKPWCRGSIYLFFSPLCLLYAKPALITDCSGEPQPLWGRRSHRIQAAAGGEPHSSGVLDGLCSFPFSSASL